MKKLILRLGIGLVVVVIVALVVAFFSLDSIVTKGFNTVGPTVTKVETRLSGAAISPFSGSGELHGLFIGNPSGFKTSSAIEAKDIKVAVKPGSIFSDKIVVDVVRLTTPEITFEGGLSGNNLSKLLSNIQGAGGSASSTNASGQKKLQVNDFLIEGGTVRVSLTELGKSFTMPLPEIHLQNLGTGSEGITPAELAQQIMGKLVPTITTAVTKQLTKLGSDVTGAGKSAGQQLEKSAKGLKDIFKP